MSESLCSAVISEKVRAATEMISDDPPSSCISSRMRCTCAASYLSTIPESISEYPVIFWKRTMPATSETQQLSIVHARLAMRRLKTDGLGSTHTPCHRRSFSKNQVLL